MSLCVLYGVPKLLTVTYEPKYKQCSCLAIWGSVGVFNNQIVPIFPPNYHLSHIYVHVKSGCNIIITY